MLKFKRQVECRASGIPGVPAHRDRNLQLREEVAVVHKGGEHGVAWRVIYPSWASGFAKTEAGRTATFTR